MATLEMKMKYALSRHNRDTSEASKFARFFTESGMPEAESIQQFCLQTGIGYDPKDWAPSQEALMELSRSQIRMMPQTWLRLRTQELADRVMYRFASKWPITCDQLRREMRHLQSTLGWSEQQADMLFTMLAGRGQTTLPAKKMDVLFRGRALYNAIDAQRNGFFTEDQLKKALVHEDAVQYFLQCPPEHAHSLMGRLNKDGICDFSRFFEYFISQSSVDHLVRPKEEDPGTGQERLFKLLGGGPLTEAVCKDRIMASPELQHELQVPNPEVAVQLFRFLDAEKQGKVGVDKLRRFCRLRWLFNLIDDDETQYIDREELGEALADEVIRRELNVQQNQAQRLFTELDENRMGRIEFGTWFEHFYKHHIPPPPPQGDQHGSPGGPHQDPQQQHKPAKSPPPQHLQPPLQPGEKIYRFEHKKDVCFRIYALNAQDVLAEKPNGWCGLVLRGDSHWWCIRLEDGREAFVPTRSVNAVDVTPSAQGGASPAHHRQPPAHLLNGKYQEDKKLSKGAFGEVWRCIRFQDGLTVALKKPLDTSAAEMEFVRQEAAIMRKLKHPNIIRWIETFENPPGVILIVCEFAAGGDLVGALKKSRGGLSKTACLHILGQLCDALRYMHGLNPQVLHRDLKPANILIAEDGDRPIEERNIKVADLGLARELRLGGGAQTECGTPNYMAPEIMEGKKYGAEADMWSAGCVLFELATGTLMFANTANVLRNQRTPGQLDHQVARFVNEMTQTDVRRRWPARTVISELKPIQAVRQTGQNTYVRRRMLV